MSTPYSRRPDTVAAVRSFLISVRDRPEAQMPRYGEVAAVYGGIARAVAPMPDSVARDCAEAGETDLSALVVLAGTGLPGRLDGGLLDPQSPRGRAAWQAELKGARAFPWLAAPAAVSAGKPGR